MKTVRLKALNPIPDPQYNFLIDHPLAKRDEYADRWRNSVQNGTLLSIRVKYLITGDGTSLSCFQSGAGHPRMTEWEAEE